MLMSSKLQLVPLISPTQFPDCLPKSLFITAILERPGDQKKVQEKERWGFKGGYFFYLFAFFLLRPFLLCSPSWLWTLRPPASVSCVLGLQVCTMRSGLNTKWKNCLRYRTVCCGLIFPSRKGLILCDEGIFDFRFYTNMSLLSPVVMDHTQPSPSQKWWRHLACFTQTIKQIAFLMVFKYTSK